MTEAKDDKLWSKEQKYESQLTFFDKVICTNCFHSKQAEHFYLFKGGKIRLGQSLKFIASWFNSESYF